MALYSYPPHRVTSHTVTTSRDAGGGTTYTFASAQSAIPCSINTAGASEVERYAQQGITVTHTVAMLSSAITTAIVRGMKVVTDDTSVAFHVKGIRSGRAYGGLPALTYLDCEQQL
jgi:hypothetical protein